VLSAQAITLADPLSGFTDPIFRLERDDLNTAISVFTRTFGGPLASAPPGSMTI